jgi:MFS family permease
VHFLLGFTKLNPVGPLVGQGLAYTGFAAVLWPAVPLVVEEKYTGLAFGVMTSMSNLGTAVLPLIVAQIFTAANNSYIPYVELLFACLGIIGFLVGLLTNYEDYYHHNSILNKVDNSLTGIVVPSSIASSQDSSSNDGAVLKERLLPEVTSSYDHGKQRQVSTERERERERSRSGGSFTAYGEVFLGGAFDNKKGERK